MREPGGDVRERISRGGPVSVIADYVELLFVSATALCQTPPTMRLARSAGATRKMTM